MNYIVYYKCDRKESMNQFRNLFPATEIESRDDLRGAFITDEAGIDQLDSILPIFNHDQGMELTCLIGYAVDQISWKMLEKAQQYRKGKCSHLSELLLDYMLNDETDLNYDLHKQFENCPQELIVTIKEYLKCGLNAKRAAEKMYLHRNTFNYRLTKFEDLTGLDIRDYHVAQYIDIVLTICAQRTK